MFPSPELPCGTPEVYAGVLATNKTQSVVRGKRNGSQAEDDVQYIANNFVRPSEAVLVATPKALLLGHSNSHETCACNSIDEASPRDYLDNPRWRHMIP